MHFAIGYDVLLHWIQTKLSWKPEIVSIRVKELFQPIVLLRKGDWCLLFFKAFSQETDLWVTPGDFELKSEKLEREIWN